ncbi:hypothetical protein B0A50_07861 [Salinomyces thailandicus]|uniref:Uncharacterized protein n=1 Tax=Salinomyces thailandicus TaxID=706561 RepID=A0A4V5N5Q0_9PEZI|nr:hypothetical protein B0A50_07861 [Salinomyces thailandica]
MNELFTTGWLDKPWEKRDILIPVLLKGQLGPLYEAVRPYLVRHFEGSSPRLLQASSAPAMQPTSDKSRSILLMLGVYITELWFGEAIESYQTGAQTSNSEALQIWYNSKRDELPMRLEEAVETCLDEQLHNDAVAALLPQIVQVLKKTQEAWD